MLLDKARIDMMQRLCGDYRDWILAELKDLSTVLEEIKKNPTHPTLQGDLTAFELRVHAINWSYMRKVIGPMKKLAERRSGAKTEEEHYGMFIDALEKAWRLIFELRCIRYKLDMVVEKMFGQEMDVGNMHPMYH
jgi:hypothetical protein